MIQYSKISSAFRYCIIFVLISLPCTFQSAFSQNVCPANIGVEDGYFTNWKCYSGNVDDIGGVAVTQVAPDPNRHLIWHTSYPPIFDRYGNFPVICPNGSRFSIQLGNDSSKNGAERLTYTFQVPAGMNEYSILYHYAVVFQDAGHTPAEQPKFSVKVLDNSASTYLSCGSFEYIASSAIPGFKKSPVGAGVYYKSWSPVTLKISNCAGKLITLEFTTNDCTRGGHFGYAYIDVDENCASPITGNVYCNGDTQLTLVAPFGFKEYNWYNQNFTQNLGNSNTLSLSPPPPTGTVYALEIIPYPGYGCRDTVYTTIKKSNENMVFNVKTPVYGCEGGVVDLTDTANTSGSSPGLHYLYFSDPAAVNYLPAPTYVNTAGEYYIKAIHDSGCTAIKPIDVVLVPGTLNLNSPPQICFPGTLDLTDSTIISGSTPGLVYSYYNDWGITPLSDPKKITSTGVYYIKGENAYCSSIKAVAVNIRKATGLVTYPISSCNIADLTAKNVTRGSEAGFHVSYWLDNAASIPISNPVTISKTGTYYLKGTDSYNCSITAPVNITILPAPDFNVSNPAAVTAPATSSITNAAITIQQGVRFTFNKDSAGRILLPDPEHLTTGGTYFITASGSNGCSATKPVQVVIYPPPPLTFYVPNVFSPNGDGINDLLTISFKGVFQTFTLTVFDRYGKPLFTSNRISVLWDGSFKGKQLSTGTYYWLIEAKEVYTQKTVRAAGSVLLVR